MAIEDSTKKPSIYVPYTDELIFQTKKYAELYILNINQNPIVSAFMKPELLAANRQESKTNWFFRAYIISRTDTVNRTEQI